MNAPVRLAAAVRSVDFNDRTDIARVESFVADREGSVFQRPLWVETTAEGSRNTPFGLVVERGGALDAWLPLTLVHSPLFGRAFVSSGFGVGGGILVSREADIEVLGAAAIELAERHNVATIELRDAAAPREWKFIEGKHANFSRELAADDEAQLLAIPRKARAEVRKGMANPLTVSVGRDETDRAAHYAVFSQSVHNLGTPVFPRSLFDAVLDGFGPDADILTVHAETGPVASVLSLYHAGTVMPFWGGGTFAARSLRASERMYYELMLHARRKGCSRFDFGRSKTGSGPFAFKKNWGFEPEPLTYRSWSAPGSAERNIDPNDASYSTKIELWKRMPLSLANAFGPHIARGLG